MLFRFSLKHEAAAQAVRILGAKRGADAAARLWVDAIIRPQDTRAALITAIEVAAHEPHIPEFRTGVLQC